MHKYFIKFTFFSKVFSIFYNLNVGFNFKKALKSTFDEIVQYIFYLKDLFWPSFKLQ